MRKSRADLQKYYQLMDRREDIISYNLIKESPGLPIRILGICVSPDTEK